MIELSVDDKSIGPSCCVLIKEMTWPHAPPHGQKFVLLINDGEGGELHLVPDVSYATNGSIFVSSGIDFDTDKECEEWKNVLLEEGFVES